VGFVPTNSEDLPNSCQGIVAAAPDGFDVSLGDLSNDAGYAATSLTQLAHAAIGVMPRGLKPPFERFFAGRHTDPLEDQLQT
jgi:hypothetical protein